MTEKLLYLGGPSAELVRVIEAAALAERMGWTIAEPWWERVQAATSLGYATDADVPDEYMAMSAQRNEEAIYNCSRIVFLCRVTGGLSSGCAYELGFAKAMIMGLERDDNPLGLPIYLVGDPKRFVGIWESPRPIVVATLEEALR